MIEKIILWGVATFALSVLIRLLTADERLKTRDDDPYRCSHCGGRNAAGMPFRALVCRRCGKELHG